MCYSAWYALDTSRPAGETEEAFRIRMNQSYADANVSPVPSGVIVIDYPEDCDAYSSTIESSMVALTNWKNDYEECLTFQSWADP